MFFLLPVLAVVAETATAVTGTVLASTGAVGAAIAAGTTAIGGIAGAAATGAATSLGIEAATAGSSGDYYGRRHDDSIECRNDRSHRKWKEFDNR